MRVHQIIASLGMLKRRCATGFLLIGLAAVTACGSYPRDVQGTLGSIQRDHIIHVGMIAGTERSPNFAKAQSYLRRIAEIWEFPADRRRY